MANLAMVVGLGNVLGAIKRIDARVQAGVSRGLRKCGVLLLRESLLEVPVDKNNLRAGGRVRHEGTGTRTVVYVGYRAAYAVYVHEDLTAAHGDVFNKKYAKEIAAYKKQYGRTKKAARPYSPYSHPRKPGEKAKFLIDPMVRNLGNFRAIVVAETSK